MNKKKEIKTKIQFQGIVVSDKMDKTVVVKVEKIKQDLKYKKKYRVHKKYFAHSNKNEYNKGDRVVIQLCSPLSKNKKWKVIRKK